MMIKEESIKWRNNKIQQQRFGISVIYNVINNNELQTILNYNINRLEKFLPDTFIWYPKWHVTFVRCESVQHPFNVSREEYAFLQLKELLKHQRPFLLKYKYSEIGEDGVLRSYFKKKKKNDFNIVDNFYKIKKLNYKIIEEPWISLGNIKLKSFENAEFYFDKLENIVGKFKIFDILVKEIECVYYEDILLQNNMCIGSISLGG